MRPAGQTKCDRWFKDNGLIAPGYQLSAQAMALIMGFPLDWFSPLCQPTPQEESEQDISQVEQLPQDKQRSLLEEFSISIPCLVKQPGHPELKGLIREVMGDCLRVKVDSKEISISKLFVYPDFSKSVPQGYNIGRIEKNPRKNLTPSKNSPRKKRRQNGLGNGSIYYRQVSKNGKQYTDAYYHYVKDGKKRTKYIPKKLLDRVKEAELLKLTVSDILVLLVGKDKSPRKSSDTKSDRPDDSGSEKVMETSVISPRKTIPTSKKRRDKGKGSGWIQCKPIKRSGKEYKQYWYHYEEWSKGDRLVKKSRYIPKRLLARVEKLEVEKVPVREILKVLTNKDRSQK